VWGSAISTILRREIIKVELLPHARGQVDGDTLASEVSRQIPNKLDLLFDREPADDGLEDGADCHSVFADQTAIIDVGEDTHQELAIHSISHSPVSGDAVTEILDVEGTLKSRSEKTTEWSDKRRKNGHDEDMEVVGCIWERRDVSPK